MIARATLVRIALLSTALGALTGCDTVGGAVSSAGSSVGGFFSHHDPNAEASTPERPRSADGGQTPDQSQRQADGSAGGRAGHQLSRRWTIADGGAALRVGGPENASVRYQFNIGDTARQCDPAGPGQAALKIGVAGDVVIGPAGAAGTFSAPVKITVTRQGDNSTVFSQTYRAEATTDGVRAGPVSHCDRSDQSADVRPFSSRTSIRSPSALKAGPRCGRGTRPGRRGGRRARPNLGLAGRSRTKLCAPTISMA